MKTLVAALSVLVAVTLTFGQDCQQNIRIANITIDTARRMDADVLAHISQDIKDHVTDACDLSEELGERVRDHFQQLGYFRAQLLRPVQVTQVEGTAVQPVFEVTVLVNEGAVYRLGHIAFTHNAVIPAADLRSLVPLQDGENFNVQKLHEGMHKLREIYGSRGYIDFTPVPNYALDDERSTIELTFDLDEGAQFHIGNLLFEGQEPFAGAANKLQEAWQPLVGKVYDSHLLEGAVSEIYPTPSRVHGDDELSAAVRQCGIVGIEMRQNNNSHTVNFLFRFPNR